MHIVANFPVDCSGRLPARSVQQVDVRPLLRPMGPRRQRRENVGSPREIGQLTSEVLRGRGGTAAVQWGRELGAAAQVLVSAAPVGPAGPK